MIFLAKDQSGWRRRGVGALMLVFTITLFLALVTDGYQGDVHRPLSPIKELARVPNLLSMPGAIIAGLMYMLLGQGSHVVYFLTGVWSIMLLRSRPFDRVPTRMLGMLLLTAAVAGLLQADMPSAQFGDLPGGALGAFAGKYGIGYLGVAGFNVVAVTLGVIGVLLATEFLFIRLVAMVWCGASFAVRLAIRLFRGAPTPEAAAPERVRPSRRSSSAERSPALLHAATSVPAGPKASEPIDRIRIRAVPQPVEADLDFDAGMDEEEVEPVSLFAAPPQADSVDDEDVAPFVEDELVTAPSVPARRAKAAQGEGQLELVTPDPDARPVRPAPSVPKRPPMPRRKAAPEAELPPDYVYPKRYKRPSLDILDPVEEHDHPDLSDQLRATSALLEETLQTFGVEARVTDVTRGPTITRFELEPAPGVKVSRFQSLADDIALALKAYRVRVEAPIPGKGRIGIEIPNEHREPVALRELLESKVFRRNQGRLTLALGKDIAGDVSVADLTTMPHLLVAGATGAGKTVCVKTLLASLLFTKTPEELQMMLIDPKMVELSIFNDIPHLITPVVIDPKKAAAALNWLIVEMEERYRLFAHLRVRNIDVYNESVENGEIEMSESSDEKAGETMDVIRKLRAS
ncbi:MAG: DNA translocase FtsK [Candidatus Hydrogenedentes bacterium]|nr:DNA translocase FtsK [Candidatus Hydrogenedentota bacterium]